MEKHQPILRLVASDGRSLSIGYRSGRRRWRDTPVKDSMANTRSAGTRPTRSQVEMDPCDLSPNLCAKAVCPPAALQASKTAGLLMKSINAQIVNDVNARTGNQVGQNVRMPKRAELPASAFWIRLTSSLPASWGEVNPNNLAERLEMSQGSVYRWYTGDGWPKLETALYLAKECGVCVDWLLNNVKPRYPISKDPVLRELLEVCEELSDEARARVLRMARGELLQHQEEKENEASRPHNIRSGLR